MMFLVGSFEKLYFPPEKESKNGKNATPKLWFYT